MPRPAGCRHVFAVGGPAGGSGGFSLGGMGSALKGSYGLYGYGMGSALICSYGLYGYGMGSALKGAAARGAVCEAKMLSLIAESAEKRQLITTYRKG